MDVFYSDSLLQTYGSDILSIKMWTKIFMDILLRVTYAYIFYSILVNLNLLPICLCQNYIA